MCICVYVYEYMCVYIYIYICMLMYTHAYSIRSITLHAFTTPRQATESSLERPGGDLFDGCIYIYI